MKLGIQTGKVNKTFSEQVQEIAKAREGLIQVTRDVKGKNGKTFQRKQWVRPEDAPKGQKPKAVEEEGKKRLGIRKPEWNPIDALEAFEADGTTPSEQWQEVYLTEQQRKDFKAYRSGKIKKPEWMGANITKKDDIKTGDNVAGVDVNGKHVSGKVTSVGTHGVTIDHKHKVEHGNVKQAKGKTESDKKESKPAVQDGKTFVPPENFNAADWSKQWSDPKATPDDAGVEYILQSFGKEGTEISEHIREVNGKIKFGSADRDTNKKFLISGKGESARYTENREKLHGAIMQALLAPDKIRAAKPALGESPTFMILGGRGGSGKSWFKDKLYDPLKYVILDADEIKTMLPEYNGWNAQDVHEESSDILEQMVCMCIREGLNFVLDGTMKTAKSALGRILRVQSAGYKTEAHYMHLPAQEAAKRAVGRYMGENKDFSGRYVPVHRVLENTTNEDSFDQVRKLVDKWSFRDNNVKRGKQPILISEGENNVKKSYAALVKSYLLGYN